MVKSSVKESEVKPYIVALTVFWGLPIACTVFVVAVYFHSVFSPRNQELTQTGSLREGQELAVRIQNIKKTRPRKYTRQFRLPRSAGVKIEEAQGSLYYLPQGFNKLFSIVSDADSLTVDVAEAQSRTMSDLGLAIPNSAFVIDAQDYRNVPGPRDKKIVSETEKAINAAFFLSKAGDILKFDSNFSKMVRNWHSGAYDHIHGLFNTRFIKKRYLETPVEINKESSIDLTAVFDDDFLDKTDPYRLEQWSRDKLSVLRLYLTKKPSRGLKIQISGPDTNIDIDVNAQRAFGRSIKENSKRFWMLELPFFAGDSASYSYPKQNVIPDRKYTVTFDPSDCGFDGKPAALGCDARIEQVELGSVSRAGVEKVLAWLDFFEVHPELYTAHGGDRLSSFATSESIQSEATRLEAEKPTDQDLDRALAGEKHSKGYILDLLEASGVRFVRPLVSSTVNGVMTMFPDPGTTRREFGNTVSAATNWAVTPEDTAQLHASEGRGLNLLPKTVNILDSYDSCNFALEGWLAGYIEASMRPSTNQFNTGEIWYTHLGAFCSDQDRLNRLSKGTEAYLKVLSQNYHGQFDEKQRAIYPNRLWVVPPTVAFRNRLLSEELKLGAMKISQIENIIEITPAQSSFFENEHFPREGLYSRDLNGLTLETDLSLLKETSVFVSGTKLNTVTKSDNGRRGYITILDTSEHISLLDSRGISLLNSNSENQAINQCVKPDSEQSLNNISSIGYSFDLEDDAVQTEPDYVIEMKFSKNDGSVVISNMPELQGYTTKSKSYALYRAPWNWSTSSTFEKDNLKPQIESRRFLVPLYTLSNFVGEKEERFQNFLQGSVTEICVTVFNPGQKSMKLSEMRAYNHVTSASNKDHDVVVSGTVSNIQHSNIGEYLVKINSGQQVLGYAAVDANGFYYYKFSGDTARLQETVYEDRLDDSRMAIPVELSLLNTSQGSNPEVIAQQRLVLSKSDFSIDFGNNE